MHICIIISFDHSNHCHSTLCVSMRFSLLWISHLDHSFSSFTIVIIIITQSLHIFQVAYNPMQPLLFLIAYSLHPLLLLHSCPHLSASYHGSLSFPCPLEWASRPHFVPLMLYSLSPSHCIYCWVPMMTMTCIHSWAAQKLLQDLHGSSSQTC